jgi:hypothetical protein
MKDHKLIKEHCKKEEVRCSKCEYYKDSYFNCKDSNGLTPNQFMYGSKKWS